MHLLASTAIFLVFYTDPVSAQSSTETYTYDPLGRLIVVETSGGQNDDETHSICYDDAGNRTEYKSTSDGSASTCTGGGSGGGTPPPPPPPPPPPSVIQITDNNLTVLPAHQSTYSCFSGNLFGTWYGFCSLTANNIQVYNSFIIPPTSPTDPGYSMTVSHRLDVTSAAYGTGVSP